MNHIKTQNCPISAHVRLALNCFCCYSLGSLLQELLQRLKKYNRGELSVEYEASYLFFISRQSPQEKQPQAKTSIQ